MIDGHYPIPEVVPRTSCVLYRLSVTLICAFIIIIIIIIIRYWIAYYYYGINSSAFLQFFQDAYCIVLCEKYEHCVAYEYVIK